METPPFEDVFPIFKMGILHCYVCLPEGNHPHRMNEASNRGFPEMSEGFLSQA